jgi:hypothetical protein
MKREELKQIIEGITDEQLKAILDLNGADINKAKGEYDTLKSELDTAKETISTLTTEAETLKANNANADEWKSKFETLQNDIAEKERAAKEEAEKAEREANILSRYNAVCVDKDGKPLEWSHEAIKSAYLQKFTEALSDETNAGKSDADIFHALTKDDAAAFKGVQPIVQLKGASTFGGEPMTKEAFAKMGYADRAKLYNENPTLYNELKGD